jgi:nicotinate-nucleotide pyrophosphorylase (carboxylating)
MREFEALLSAAFEEDLGSLGDVTSQAIFGPEDRARAVLVSKDSGLLCGAELFKRCFLSRDPSIEVEALKADGEALDPGDLVARVRGPTRAILEAERTAINFLGYLSGIATMARRFVDASARAGRAVILDTRKTLPGYRALAKFAVRVGGATNHRMGLHDMILIKDNHIDAAGGIEAAVGCVRAMWGSRFRIEVECRSLEDLEEAARLGVDVAMLDNMGPEDCAEAARRHGGRILLEASGNMDEGRVAAYSAAGVDYISVGKLTHSARSFDFSLRIEA